VISIAVSLAGSGMVTFFAPLLFAFILIEEAFFLIEDNTTQYNVIPI